eukprot:4887207-Pyramimonas_sp.AAC.1
MDGYTAPMSGMMTLMGLESRLGDKHIIAGPTASEGKFAHMSLMWFGNWWGPGGREVLRRHKRTRGGL